MHYTMIPTNIIIKYIKLCQGIGKRPVPWQCLEFNLFSYDVNTHFCTQCFICRVGFSGGVWRGGVNWREDCLIVIYCISSSGNDMWLVFIIEMFNFHVVFRLRIAAYDNGISNFLNYLCIIYVTYQNFIIF